LLPKGDIVEILTKHPVLSAVAAIGAGLAGMCIYGLVLYDFNLLAGLAGIFIGLAMLASAVICANALESKSDKTESISS
jgi:hypothetical protein